MADDIVTQLRFIVPIHEGRRGHNCIAAAADEIERLRAENEALNAMFEKRRNLAIQFADEGDYLQALIDAWAEARTLFNDGHDPWTEAEWDAYTAARDALLAAATPQEDDR